jgi:hypothetical protein
VEETGDMRYTMSVTRLVIKAERSAQNSKTAGFFMSIAPSPEYLESTDFKPFGKVRYLERDSCFSGAILFHNLDGSFSNGWLYKNGKIIDQLSANGAVNQAKGRTVNTKAASCTTYAVYDMIQVTQDHYYYHPGYGDTTYSYTSTEYYYMVSDVYTSCSDTTSSSDSTIANGGGGSYTGGGGGNGSNNYGAGTNGGTTGESQPAVRTDCTHIQDSIAYQIQRVLTSHNSNPTYKSVDIYVAALWGFAATGSIEVAAAIAQDTTAFYWYWHFDNWRDSVPLFMIKQLSTYSNGEFWIQPKGQNESTQNSTATQAITGSDKETYFLIHTHPTTSNSAPSPQDAIELGNIYRRYQKNPEKSQIRGNVALSWKANSSQPYTAYAVFVCDTVKFHALCKNPDDSLFFHSDTLKSKFEPGTDYALTYDSVYTNCITQQYSQNDAQAHALAYVLDKYNTGMKIYKSVSNNRSLDFKELITERTKWYNYINYYPKICP